jgi:AbrB family looped-hinge helix DNA binding protein
MPRLREFVAVQKRGVITLPAAVRERLSLNTPGAQLEIVETDDGRFEIRGAIPVPADQAWFWTDRWQRMEHEADADLAAGRVATADSVDELLDELDG